MEKPQCTRCDLAYESEETCRAHWATYHCPENFCNDCSRSFGSKWALMNHLQGSRLHRDRYCKRCRIIFASMADRDEHWKTAQEHLTVQHLSRPDVSCDRELGHSESMLKHQTDQQGSIGAEHECYDAVCNIHFESRKGLLAHCLETPQKHHMCVPCGLLHENHEQLQAHFETGESYKLWVHDTLCDMYFDSPRAFYTHIMESTEKHQLFAQENTIFDEICGKMFADPHLFVGHLLQTSEKHTMVVRSKPHFEMEPPEEDLATVGEPNELATISHGSKPRCFGCDEELPDMFAMFLHLESGKCAAGWTIQMVNALTAASPESASYVIKEQEAWFLAGPPSRQMLRNRSRIMHQRSAQSNGGGPYPHVLRCPGCVRVYTRLSALIRHLEAPKDPLITGGWQHCSAELSKGAAASLLAYLKTAMADPATRKELSKTTYKLEFNRNGPHEFIVRVLRKS